MERRRDPGDDALAITETVEPPRPWRGGWTRSPLLHKAVTSHPGARTGPDGALFPVEFFEEETGEVTAFVPVDGTEPGKLPHAGAARSSYLPSRPR